MAKLVKKNCTKKRPFVPPLKKNVLWTHVDAISIDPPEYDGNFPTFHCPNCGLTFTLDWR